MEGFLSERSKNVAVLTERRSAVRCRYEEKTPASARAHERALRLFPDGVTHVARRLKPYPLFVERAAGARKWDLDGNEYVDYFGGHGALILGHAHPAVTEAVQRQAERGNQFGAEHQLALEWAELICELTPCAERVRFTSAGSEAVHLALWLARVYTGKKTVLRFEGHFHGWHDQIALNDAEAPPPEGVPEGVLGDVIALPPSDAAALETVLSERDDVAAVILEPTGAGFGRVPLSPETLQRISRAARRHGVLLIFDEVVTGFRCSLGGAQQFYGVTPDLATLAKIVAGGYNGGAVVGRADLFEALAFGEGPGGVSPPAIRHQGTFNAAAVSAAAGIATLKLLRQGGFIERANAIAARLRDEMNARLKKRGLGWTVYGEFSAFHILPLEAAESPADIYAGRVPWRLLKSGTPPEFVDALRLAFLCEGVDLWSWPGGMVSGVHEDRDIEATLTAFDRALDALTDSGGF